MHRTRKPLSHIGSLGHAYWAAVIMLHQYAYSISRMVHKLLGHGDEVFQNQMMPDIFFWNAQLTLTLTFPLVLILAFNIIFLKSYFLYKDRCSFQQHICQNTRIFKNFMLNKLILIWSEDGYDHPPLFYMYRINYCFVGYQNC